MRFNKEKPSKNVVRDIPYAQSTEFDKSDRKRQTSGNIDGKRNNERIYQTPAFRRAIEDISSEFQSRTRTDGKGNRERKALSFEEITNIFRKK